MKRIAIFASGSGSNAEKIAEYFSENDQIEVRLILTNNPDAGVIKRAKKFHIPVLVFDRHLFYQTERILETLQNEKIDYVILAGFMMLIPPYLVSGFENKMLNIHPALLPKFGGKGMYGQFVHEAVVAAGEKESGITIHFVNEHYDEGNVIFQATCEVLPTDTADQVADKIHALEHAHFPRVIDELISQNA